MARDLTALGLDPGAIVMAHVGFRSVGRCINGADTLIAAIRQAIGSEGTLVVATDWHAPYLEDDLLDDSGRVPAEWREHISPFDPATSRSMRDNGVFAEWMRTTRGAVRSRNPNCSVAAIGARAEWLIADQPLDYGYGPGSPLAKLLEAGGSVAMIGAPGISMTLLHHAENLADVRGKIILREEIPYATPEGTVWRMNEEYESSDAIVPGFSDDYFDDILADFVTTGQARAGKVGDADTLLIDARAIVAFATGWIERAVAAQRPPN
ncbi:aminoglycoside 3-N-acetyltransferase [Sphingomonas qomolangmaensis]|uniref:Aminoglycoside N(3)-acetyltransferase n=1 Tax=Sphingomonas qomolangmaensis TaxID=2918765 RepID=A0ABY5L467_9SPHN|nr:aminoglycoside 3-N-acetyltransferase [Sphingomonas qomolangmaensis]UUL81745.1 aminoglycoside 3-N-acetyltransferase [Sphingomonas qomolangmaensis]